METEGKFFIFSGDEWEVVGSDGGNGNNGTSSSGKLRAKARGRNVNRQVLVPTLVAFLLAFRGIWVVRVNDFGVDVNDFDRSILVHNTSKSESKIEGNRTDSGLASKGNRTDSDKRTLMVNTRKLAMIPHLEEMRRRNLTLSYRQQLRFFTAKDDVVKSVRFKPRGEEGGHRYAYILNDDYAFRHIFKNGGTTVEWQLGNTPFPAQVPYRYVKDKKLVTVVRDPIDHFLSGWAECGERGQLGKYDPPYVTAFVESDYDHRVASWLRTMLQDGKNICRPHSRPQANFLLWGGTYPRLDLVGDLRELPQVLELTGFRFDYNLSRTKGEGNAASESDVKRNLYPKRVDLLSNETLKKLCNYLALDYYLFDFEPPAPCREDPKMLPLLSSLPKMFI